MSLSDECVDFVSSTTVTSQACKKNKKQKSNKTQNCMFMSSGGTESLAAETKKHWLHRTAPAPPAPSPAGSTNESGLSTHGPDSR